MIEETEPGDAGKPTKTHIEETEPGDAGKPTKTHIEETEPGDAGKPTKTHAAYVAEGPDGRVLAIGWRVDGRLVVDIDGAKVALSPGDAAHLAAWLMR